MTGTDDLRLDRFHRVCLKKIMRIRWPKKTSNEELYRLTSTKPVIETSRERRWRYIGHILRREFSSYGCKGCVNLETRGKKEER